MRTLTIITAGGQKYTSTDPQVVAVYLSQGSDVFDESGKKLRVTVSGNTFNPANIWLDGVSLLASNPPSTGQVITNAITPAAANPNPWFNGNVTGAAPAGAVPMRTLPTPAGMISQPTTTPLKAAAAAATIISLVRFFL